MDAELTLLAAALAALVLLVASCGRVLPEHQRAVITRLGRTRRVSGPGVVLHLPGVEQVTLVSLRDHHVPLFAATVTRDGVAARTTGSAVFRVVDPAKVTSAEPDHVSATANEVEARIAKAVSSLPLAGLLPAREGLELSVTGEVNTRTASWGTEVVMLELTDFEVRLSAELLHSARCTRPGDDP